MHPRFGMTIPLDGVSLAEHRAVYTELADLGYTDLWSAEANGADAFTPLALAAAWTDGPDTANRPRLGCAIVPAYTRGPALMAQSVAAMAEAAPGRFVFGIGTSSNVIVENWNAIPFDEPYKKTRDMVRFLKAALTGEKVDESYETFRVKGFRLGRKLPQGTPAPPILIAALRPGMLKLAGTEGDGAIINWLSADDVKTVAPYVNGKEVVARIFVCPTEDVDTVRAYGKMAIAAYLNVPVYAAFHEWLGRGDALQGMWDAWKAGDRKAATAAIPDAVVDDLIVHGTPQQCREHLDRYVANGVTTPVLAVMPFGLDVLQAARDLAPASR
jgi:probable F420-dependent oxidoreductase